MYQAPEFLMIPNLPSQNDSCVECYNVRQVVDALKHCDIVFR